MKNRDVRKWVKSRELNEAQELLLACTSAKKLSYSSMKSPFFYLNEMMKETTSPRVISALANEFIWDSGIIEENSILLNNAVNLSSLDKLLRTAKTPGIQEKFFSHPHNDDERLLKVTADRTFDEGVRLAAYRKYQERNPEFEGVPFEWFEATR